MLCFSSWINVCKPFIPNIPLNCLRLHILKISFFCDYYCFWVAAENIENRWNKQNKTQAPVIVLEWVQQSQVRIIGGVASPRSSWGTGMTDTLLRCPLRPRSNGWTYCVHRAARRHAQVSNLHIKRWDVPQHESCEAPGEEFKLLSILASGERVVCRAWMVKQSVRASWVATAADFI